MEKDNNKAVTTKEKLFIEHYIRTFNATESYLQAGYNGKRSTASVESSKLLRKPNVSAYFEQRTKELLNSHFASTDSLMLSMFNMAFGNETDDVVVYVGEGVQDVSQVRVPARERRQAREFLLKLLSAGKKDKVEIEKMKLQVKELRNNLKDNVTQEDRLTIYLRMMASYSRIAIPEREVHDNAYEHPEIYDDFVAFMKQREKEEAEIGD